MSYPINQKLNPTYQPTMGLNQQQLQNVDADKIQQGLTQNSALKGVTGGEEKNGWMAPVLTLPVFLAMGKGMDVFNKKCGGDYNTSVLGKVGDWGEKVGSGKFFQSAPMQKLEKAFTSAHNTFYNKIVPKNKILSAIFTTPSEPKNHMVLMMKGGTKSEVAADAIQKIEEYLKTAGNELKHGGKNFDITKLEELKKISHSEAGVKQILEICKENRAAVVDAKRIGKIPFTKGKKYLSEVPGMKWVGDVFGRKVEFAEYANKMEVFTNPKATTWLGKSLPKGLLRVVEGLTNGTAGGKIAILMAAYFVADAIKKTIDAPKGEKTSTFSENLTYNEAMYLTMPLGLKIMHGMGGLQYIGVSKEKVEAFRKAQTEFNDAVKAGLYKDEAAYNTAKKEIKAILKPEIKGNGFTKFLKGTVFEPLKAAARFLTVGLENFESFNPKNITKESGFLEKAGQFFLHGKAKGFKWALGGPTRFIFYLFVIAPPLGKLGAKASHLIFGRPTKSVLDEGEEPKKEETKQPLPVMPRNQSQQTLGLAAPQKTDTLANSQMAPVQGGNVVNQYNVTPQTNLVANATAQKTMAMPQEPVRTYVPSSEGVKIQEGNDKNNRLGIGVPAVDMAMSRADRAEQVANKYAH